MEAQSFDGASYSLSQFTGQVVYVDFWTSWCIPCRKSFPWMNKMHHLYSEQGLKVIA
ncbi:TlpA disulfide reductase family protein [Shewanella atlantica]|uniref:TlpA disulfide reductase family protein n=1 Tax=Shewanella atlantica TaxID=271099 RepID=UPI001FE8DC48|nr:TlpA disulfide reductase family protein [Shewanella atlantica]